MFNRVLRGRTIAGTKLAGPSYLRLTRGSRSVPAPGRSDLVGSNLIWRTLFMKCIAVSRVSFVILALAAAASLPARADEWSKTFNLTGKPDLRVETSDANIRVDTWDQNTIQATVTTVRYKIGDDGIKIQEHQTGDVVELDVHYPHTHGLTIDWGQRRVDIVIHMPREGKVKLRTEDGKIEIAGFKGEMDLHSGDGSETLDAVDGKLHATTGDGHIDLDMPVATQGQIRENEVRGKLNGGGNLMTIRTGDGSIHLRKG